MSIFKVFAFFLENFFLYNPENILFLKRGAVNDEYVTLRCIINADGISGVIDFWMAFLCLDTGLITVK